MGEASIEAFECEVKAYQALLKRKCTTRPRLLGYGCHAETFYRIIVTEIYSDSLADRTSVPQATADAAKRALKQIHDCKVLRNNLQKANIVRSGERILLADFGCATILGCCWKLKASKMHFQMEEEKLARLLAD